MRDEQSRTLLVRSNGEIPEVTEIAEVTGVGDRRRAACAGSLLGVGLPGGGLLGFVLLQFCAEACQPTLYILELQLIPQVP